MNDNEKMTPFEDLLTEVLIECQGLMTYDACAEAAKKYAGELRYFAKTDDMCRTYKPNTTCDGCNNYKGCITCENGEQWARVDEMEDEPEPIETKEEIAKQLLYVCEKSYKNGYRDGKYDTERKLPTWKKTEPEPGNFYVLMFEGGSVISTDDYRPKEGVFYYEDGDFYPDIRYDSESLIGWMYVDELMQLTK